MNRELNGYRASPVKNVYFELWYNQVSWSRICDYKSGLAEKTRRKRKYQNLLSDVTKYFPMNEQNLWISAFQVTCIWRWRQYIVYWIHHFVQNPMNFCEKQMNEKMLHVILTSLKQSRRIFLSKLWTQKRTMNSHKMKTVRDIRKTFLTGDAL